MTTSAAFNSWIAFRKPNPQARLRLFCFPYAGTGASIFRTWPDGLPAELAGRLLAGPPPGPADSAP